MAKKSGLDKESTKELKRIWKWFRKHFESVVLVAIKAGEDEKTIRRRLKRMANGTETDSIEPDREISDLLNACYHKIDELSKEMRAAKDLQSMKTPSVSKEDIKQAVLEALKDSGQSCRASEILACLGSPNDNDSLGDKHTVFRKLNALFDLTGIGEYNGTIQSFVSAVENFSGKIGELNRSVGELVVERDKAEQDAAVKEAVAKAVIETEDKMQAELNQKLSKAMADASSKETKLNEEIHDLQVKLQSTMGSLSERETELREVKAKADSQESRFSEQADNLNKQLESVNDRLRDREKELIEANDNERKLTGQIKTMQDEMNNIRRNLQNREEELREARDEASSKEIALAGQIETLQGELANVKGSLHDREEDLMRTKAAASEKESELREQVGGLSAELSAVSSQLDSYIPVLERLQACETFADFLAEKNISGKDNATLFALARAIGETTDFAQQLHGAAVAKKKESKEPMTSTEADVYQAINECYRSIWGVDFDIFISPGGQSVSGEYRCTDFNKNDMTDLLDPRNKASRYAQQVYVPLLQSRIKNRICPAQVKAGNART